MQNIFILISRGLLFAIGILFIFIAFGLLFNTQEAASGVGLNISTIEGFATVRADIAGYFAVSGALLLYSSFARVAQYLWPVLLLIAAAFLGRIITIFINGYNEESFIPMGVELIIIILIIYAQRNWRQSHFKNNSL